MIESVCVAITAFTAYAVMTVLYFRARDQSDKWEAEAKKWKAVAEGASDMNKSLIDSRWVNPATQMVVHSTSGSWWIGA